MKRVAVIGDVHGCLDEFRELVEILSHHSLDAIRHAGDLVDRGPDSGGCVTFAREEEIEGVMGNHESVLLERYNKGPKKNPNEDHERSFHSIRTDLDWEYLRNLPHLHVDDNLHTVYVHAGLWPGINLYSQCPAVVRTVQMVHPLEKMGNTKWFGVDRKGESEEELRAKGWVRWYEVCDHPYTVIYGHSVYGEPLIHNNTIGVDTGCVYGGYLTAVILPERKFVRVKAKREYWPRTERVAHVGFK